MLTVWCRLALDRHDKLRRKMCGQALNDIEELHDFLLAQGVNLVVQQFDFKFRLHIYPVVVLCVPAVNFGLAVLAHHNDGRCVGGLERKYQIQQNEGIRVPMVDERHHVQDDPNAQQDALNDNESPRPNCFGDPISKRRPSRHYQLGDITSGLLRPEVSQALEVLGAQMHFVAQRVGHCCISSLIEFFNILSRA